MKPQPSCIAPERLYPLRGFYAASGITPARRTEARRHGIELPTIDVGRRKFVQGSDAIAFIKALAALPKESDALASVEA
ncbi:MAG: hypothetical protein AB7G28_25145 [Pirellulales bacterium]